VRWRWLAEPFGTSAPETNPSGLGVFTQNLRFPGQYADQESGLFYNYHRYYNAAGGQYTQSDPIGLAAGSLTTYGYVGGNPLLGMDPDGTTAVWALYRAGRMGWKIGELINPAVQPYIAAGLDRLLLPDLMLSVPLNPVDDLNDREANQSIKVPYPDRRKGKYTCICRANRDGRCPDNVTNDNKDVAFGYGEGEDLQSAKRAAEKQAKDILGAKSTHHVQCRCRDPKGVPIIPHGG
jgi:RHS repeat-associated protein